MLKIDKIFLFPNFFSFSLSLYPSFIFIAFSYTIGFVKEILEAAEDSNVTNITNVNNINGTAAAATTAAADAEDYNASSIKVLRGLEAVKKRPEM